MVTNPAPTYIHVEPASYNRLVRAPVVIPRNQREHYNPRVNDIPITYDEIGRVETIERVFAVSSGTSVFLEDDPAFGLSVKTRSIASLLSRPDQVTWVPLFMTMKARPRASQKVPAKVLDRPQARQGSFAFYRVKSVGTLLGSAHNNFPLIVTQYIEHRLGFNGVIVELEISNGVMGSGTQTNGGRVCFRDVHIDPRFLEGKAIIHEIDYPSQKGHYLIAPLDETDAQQVFLPQDSFTVRFAICNDDVQSREIARNLLDYKDVGRAEGPGSYYENEVYGPTAIRLPRLSEDYREEQFSGLSAANWKMEKMFWSALAHLKANKSDGYFVPQPAGWFTPYGLADAGPGAPGGKEIRAFDGETNTNAQLRWARLRRRMNQTRMRIAMTDKFGVPVSAQSLAEKHGGELPYDYQLYGYWSMQNPWFQAHDTGREYNKGLTPFEGYQRSFDNYGHTHMTRWLSSIIAEVQLSNSWAAKDQLLRTAEYVNHSFCEMPHKAVGYDGHVSLLEHQTEANLHPQNTGLLGRGNSWAIFAMVAAWMISEDYWRNVKQPWFDACADFIEKTTLNSFTTQRVDSRWSALSPNPYDASVYGTGALSPMLDCAQTFEVAIADSAREAMARRVTFSDSNQNFKLMSAIYASALYRHNAGWVKFITVANQGKASFKAEDFPRGVSRGVGPMETFNSCASLAFALRFAREVGLRTDFLLADALTMATANARMVKNDWVPRGKTLYEQAIEGFMVAASIYDDSGLAHSAALVSELQSLSATQRAQTP